MKNTLTLLCLCVIIGLSSCGNGGNSPLPVVPTPDSVSNGSTLTVTLMNGPDTMKSFNILAYTKNNVAYYSIYGNIIYSTSDSLYHLKIQVLDYKQKLFGLYLDMTNTTAGGTYYSNNNSSTFTDYSDGANTTYLVSKVSSVNITQSSFPITGTFNLELFHNHDSLAATGNFKIFH